jgi:hypothetical protein
MTCSDMEGFGDSSFGDNSAYVENTGFAAGTTGFGGDSFGQAPAQEYNYESQFDAAPQYAAASNDFYGDAGALSEPAFEQVPEEEVSFPRRRSSLLARPPR